MFQKKIKNMEGKNKINRPVHCMKCLKILFHLKEETRFNIKSRCPHCGVDQIVDVRPSVSVSITEVV